MFPKTLRILLISNTITKKFLNISNIAPIPNLILFNLNFLTKINLLIISFHQI